MSPAGGSTLITSAPKSNKITAPAGPAMTLLRSRTFNPEKILSLAISCLLSLYKGAETCDGFANDQRLHLVRAFVGIEGFSIAEISRDVIVKTDAVATANLPRPRDRLSRFGRGESLRQRRMVVAH